MDYDFRYNQDVKTPDDALVLDFTLIAAKNNTNFSKQFHLGYLC